MTEDQQLIDYLLLLRFGTCDVGEASRPLLNYASIAKFMNKPVSTITHLIKLGMDAKMAQRPIQRRKRTKLEQPHLDYLCSQTTLNEWAHLSLKQRAVMFHRTFPEIKISATLLWRTYKQRGVKFKFIHRGKKVIDYGNPYYYNLFRDMYDAVKVTRHRDVKLVWVDEAMFTFNTFSTRAWSAKHQSIEVNDADIRIKAMAFLGAISDNGGLEAYTIHPKAITTKEFIEFVEMLSDKFHGQEFAIFMDNLQVHKTKDVLDTCKRLKARPIFNVPYSPDFNGIETYFSLLKGEYKKLILERLIKRVKVDSKSLIMQSIQKVDQEKAKICVGAGLRCIRTQA